MGFEPTTPGTTNQCSNQLSYIHHLADANIENVFRFMQLIFQKSDLIINWLYFRAIHLLYSAE